MIAPHELKNKTFSRSVRGYQPQEVDEYFDFLIEKYTEAYKACSEWEKKYATLQAEYEELSKERKSIQSTLLKAQKLGDVIIENANAQAEERKAKLRGECDEIVLEAKGRIREEKDKLLALRNLAVEFQQKLYEEYVRHISVIKEMKIEEIADVDSEIRGDALLDAAEEKVLREAGADVPDPAKEPDQKGSEKHE